MKPVKGQQKEKTKAWYPKRELYIGECPRQQDDYKMKGLLSNPGQAGMRGFCLFLSNQYIQFLEVEIRFRLLVWAPKVNTDFHLIY